MSAFAVQGHLGLTLDVLAKADREEEGAWKTKLMVLRNKQRGQVRQSSSAAWVTVRSCHKQRTKPQMGKDGRVQQPGSVSLLKDNVFSRVVITRAMYGMA